MSKVDAMRALREARRAAASAPAARVAARPATPPVRAVPVADPSPGQEASGLCGHRSMNGRSCTRTSGHSEKNHRYG